MKKGKVKEKLKKIWGFFANPKLLLCFGLAWLVTNGWAYILLGIGLLLDIAWMQAVAGAYLAFLWIPLTPEKIITVIIAVFLLTRFFPKDKKTLGILMEISEKVKENYKKRKENKKEKENTN